MNEIQQMQRFLLKAFSTARITLDEPISKDGMWSLNVFLPDYHLAVAWQVGKGFGVVSDDSHGYGEGADEVFEDLERALPRVVQRLAYRLATEPPRAVRLNLLVLRTPKLEDLRKFYSALGAHFESERHGNGPEHYAAMLGDGMVLELYPTLDGAAPDPGLRLGLSVDDIEEALRTLGQNATPRQTQGGLRALVRDPDGRTVELLQFRKTETVCVRV